MTRDGVPGGVAPRRKADCGRSSPACGSGTGTRLARRLSSRLRTGRRQHVPGLREAWSRQHTHGAHDTCAPKCSGHSVWVTCTCVAPLHTHGFYMSGGGSPLTTESNTGVCPRVAAGPPFRLLPSRGAQSSWSGLVGGASRRGRSGTAASRPPSTPSEPSSSSWKAQKELAPESSLGTSALPAPPAASTSLSLSSGLPVLTLCWLLQTPRLECSSVCGRPGEPASPRWRS